MLQKFKILLFILLFACLNPLHAAYDSLGIKTVEGVQYIIHKVDAKETLFSIAKRYNVTVSDITKVNEAEKEGLNIDQINRVLLIPFKSSQQDLNVAQITRTSKSHPNKHIVMGGETLYSLSKKYTVSTKDLQKWNSLEGTNLPVGKEIWISSPESNSDEKPVIFTTKTEKKLADQNLKKEVEHTVDFGETIYSISKAYDVSQEDIMVWNRLKDTNIAVGQTLIIKSNKAPEKQKSVKLKTSDLEEKKYVDAVQRFHNAEKGENYKAVASRYSLKVTDLKKWNNFKEPFQGGEVIKIVAPTESKELIKSSTDKDTENRSNNEDIHIVEAKETIYSLADLYEVEMEDLRKWNNLTNYQLSIGQKLYIKNPDKMETETTEDSKDKIQLEIDEVKESKSVQAENPQKQDTKAYFTVEEEDIPKIDKISEKGVAEVIAGSESTEKYLALHRTAKIGTIIQVRNDLNDQIVFVRVLGKLPNNGVDDKVIIRISKKAFEKLGGVDYKFPVEISYLPLKD
jgi:LysM repeat protein